MMAHDNLASGNNFYCYNLVSSNDLKWQIVEFDFDECLTYNSETNEPDEDPDIIRFFIRDDDSDPLLTRILELDAYTGAYLDYYSTFITEIFGAGSPQQPSERLSELYNFILPWVSQDKLWQISYGMTTEKFTECAMNSVTNLNTRYKDVYNQLQSFGKTL
jgi:hypothetical protein